jgi:hypothetical protein
MTDYTNEVIAKYLKDNNLDAPEDDGIIQCIEYWDWIDEVCEINNINKFVRNYVNFEKMLLRDADMQIYVRLNDGTFQDIGYYIPSGPGWDVRAGEYIEYHPHDVYVIKCH